MSKAMHGNVGVISHEMQAVHQCAAHGDVPRAHEGVVVGRQCGLSKAKHREQRHSGVVAT
jgi:hypothetical protein